MMLMRDPGPTRRIDRPSRFWRRALWPLMKAAVGVVASARAVAPIDGEPMRRVPKAKIDALTEAWAVARTYWPENWGDGGGDA